MLISLGLALLLIIAALKLGAAGVTLYNLIRLVVGSLAYVAIGGLLIYLFFLNGSASRRDFYQDFSVYLLAYS